MQRAVIVVPCFNEEHRLEERAFLPLLEREGVDVIFVDDGSRDGTARVLRAIAGENPTRIGVLELAQNQGKAEAVRRGMSQALERGAEIVGYMDADASAPASELLRLLDAMQADGADVVIGARVKLLGNDVERRRVRHYLGRIFATAASAALALPVYDTQCGAKLFRASAALRAALSAPFASRWVFDVELLGRLLTGSADAPATPRERFLEVPLRTWHHVAGSKLKATSMVKSGLELAAIGLRMRTRRRRLNESFRTPTRDMNLLCTDSAPPLQTEGASIAEHPRPNVDVDVDGDAPPHRPPQFEFRGWTDEVGR